jgi:hypothetical protein
MAKRKGERLPRLPTAPSLPMTFEEAEEAIIIDTGDKWFIRIADKLTSDASHAAVRDDIYRQLGLGADAALPLDDIVDMARANHPPADEALRAWIRAAIDTDRFNDLPQQVRDYARHALRRTSAPSGYPSNASQVVNDYVLHIAIGLLIDMMVAHWPHVPALHSSTARHSHCWLLAVIFNRHGIKLGEQQIRRIYKGRQTLGRRLAEFLVGTLPFGQPPKGS